MASLAEQTYFLPCPMFTALLTDFHNSDPKPILESLEANQPELITIAGDLIYGDFPEGGKQILSKRSKTCALLRGCVGIAPTFMSLGNHEWMLSGSDLKVISDIGVGLLDNKWLRFRDVVIGGLSSAYYTEYRAICDAHPEKGPYPVSIRTLQRETVRPETEWLDKFEKQPGYKILLCHHPEYYPEYLQDRNIDLILSGHAHGGQWRYYSLLRREWAGIFAPGQGFFPRLTSGVKDSRLVISRGLSNPTKVPRINNPPEIVYIRPE